MLFYCIAFFTDNTASVGHISEIVLMIMYLLFNQMYTIGVNLLTFFILCFENMIMLTYQPVSQCLRV